MATLADIRSLVAGDLAVGSALNAEITNAINAACEEFSSTRFWFNESRSITFSTVAGQEFYTSTDNGNLPNFAMIDDLFLSTSTQVWSPDWASNDEIELAAQPSTGNGKPYRWTYYLGQIRFFPIPDAVYTCRITGILKAATLNSDLDTNVFTLYATNLIRLSATRRIYMDTLRDQTNAALALQSEQGAYDALSLESVKKMRYGRIQATDF